MITKTTRAKLAFIPSLICSLCTVLLLDCIYKTGIIKGLNTAVDMSKQAIAIEAIKSQTVEGIFIDHDGVEITSYSGPGESAHANYPKSFGYLIGYNSYRMGTSGLRSSLYNYLFDGRKDNIGATVQLTIDAVLQENAYELLNGTVGSISVIDAETGQIIVLTSRGDETVDLNINQIDEKYDDTYTYYSDYYNSIKEFWFNRCVFAQDPPGSCGKIITTSSLVENGLVNLIYYDEGSELNGMITNFRGEVYGQCDLEKALNKSINTYFANAGLTLGNTRLKKTFNKFMVGTPIELDFTILDSTYSVDAMDDYLVASNAYGQGQLIMSPLHLAMSVSAIMNNGNMMTPYVIEKITNDNKTLYSGKEKLLNSVMSSNESRQVKELLHSNAIDYGFYDYYDDDIYIIAKTGTAEIDGRDLDHIYFTVGVEINGKSFGICIDDVYSETTGFSMKTKVINLIDYLIDYSYREEV